MSRRAKTSRACGANIISEAVGPDYCFREVEFAIRDTKR